MNIVSLDDAIIGSILAKSITVGGQSIYKRGVPVTQSMLANLREFGVKKICVDSIFNESIDSHIGIANLNNMVLQGIRGLDIDKIMVCSRQLVHSITNGEFDASAMSTYVKDAVTYNHSLNVASLALTCGISMGLPLHSLRALAIGSLLHDIGKYKIDSDILNKPGKLTGPEFEDIKLHPGIGYGMLLSFKNIPEAAKKIVLQHHENWDGTGYPQGLSGWQVSRLARLVHIADAYEALCAERPYKDALPRSEVRLIMLEGTGTKYDPHLLRAFLNSIPLYTVGEEIQLEGDTGVVCGSLDNGRVIVRCGDTYMNASLVDNGAKLGLG